MDSAEVDCHILNTKTKTKKQQQKTGPSYLVAHNILYFTFTRRTGRVCVWQNQLIFSFFIQRFTQCFITLRASFYFIFHFLLINLGWFPNATSKYWTRRSNYFRMTVVYVIGWQATGIENSCFRLWSTSNWNWTQLFTSVCWQAVDEVSVKLSSQATGTEHIQLCTSFGDKQLGYIFWRQAAGIYVCLLTGSWWSKRQAEFTSNWNRTLTAVYLFWRQ